VLLLDWTKADGTLHRQLLACRVTPPCTIDSLMGLLGDTCKTWVQLVVERKVTSSNIFETGLQTGHQCART
jgi:hypothetical protein